MEVVLVVLAVPVVPIVLVVPVITLVLVLPVVLVELSRLAGPVLRLAYCE